VPPAEFIFIFIYWAYIMSFCVQPSVVRLCVRDICELDLLKDGAKRRQVVNKVGRELYLIHTKNRFSATTCIFAI
jgi:hypothetical protein